MNTITKLRAEFIKHMDFQGLAPHTQRGYITGVKGLAKFYNKSPDLLTDDEVREYFRYLITERKLAWSSCHNYLVGITYFFRNFCQREVKDRFGLPSSRFHCKKLPFAFSIEEMERLLSSIDNLKHRVLLKTIYSAGLRVGEAVKLRSQDIESDPSRMLIRVEQGKGRKDRYTILSQALLPELREYWLRYHPDQWLFPGQKPGTHITTTSASVIFTRQKKAGINRDCGIHTLRHSFATHLLYQRVDLYTISRLLGHASIKTTTIYLHIIPERFAKLHSPLDQLNLAKED